MKTATEKRRIYVSHDANMKYWNGLLPTWRTPFCYIVRTVTPTEDPDGIWETCATLNTPSGVVLILDGEDIVAITRAAA